MTEQMLRCAFSDRIGLFFGIEVVDDSAVVIALHGCPNIGVRSAWRSLTADVAGSLIPLKHGLVSAS